MFKQPSKFRTKTILGYPATIQYHLACVYHTDENRTENIFTDACSLDHVILAGEDSWG